MGIIRRLSLRFDDDCLEADWQAAQRARAVPMVRRAIVGLGLLVLAGVVLQRMLAEVLELGSFDLMAADGRQTVGSMVGARVTALFIGLGLPYLALRTALGRRYPAASAAWVMTWLVGALGVGIALGAPPEMARRMAYLGPVLLPANFFLFGLGARAGLASTAPVLLAMVGVATLGHVTGADAALLISASIYVIYVCSFGAHHLERQARAAFASAREVARARARSETLLRAILPEPIAEELKRGPGRIASGHPAVTVLFSDIVGFTRLSQTMPPEQLVGLLHDLFSRFDAAAEALGIEKIKTIGDAYMAVAGLPEPRADHAEAAARLALAMLDEIRSFRADTGHAVDIRIGLHSGAVVAGVIGTTKFCYDLWGDTVNTAARMESHGLPGAVQVSEATAGLLRASGFRLDDRGPIPVKGKGEMHTWLLAGAPPAEP